MGCCQSDAASDATGSPARGGSGSRGRREVGANEPMAGLAPLDAGNDGGEAIGGPPVVSFSTANDDEDEKKPASLIERRRGPGSPIVPPFFEFARQRVALRTRFFSLSKIGRYRKHFARVAERDPDLMGEKSPEDIFRALVGKAEGLPSFAVEGIDHDNALFQALVSVYSHADSNQDRAAILIAASVLSEITSQEQLNALLASVCDICKNEATVHRGALVLISSAGTLLENRRERPVDDEIGPSGTSTPPPPGEPNNGPTEPPSRAQLALAFVAASEILEDYVEQHKSHAVAAAFTEPLRFVNKSSEGKPKDVDASIRERAVHWGFSTFTAALGVELPEMPVEDFSLPCDAFDNPWSKLNDSAWAVFSDPANFGLSAETLASRQLLTQDHIRANNGSAYAPPKPPSVFATALRSDVEVQQRFRRSVENFAHFFTTEFFLRKALETLNGETKPEHTGWRRACTVLFREFQELVPSAADYDDFDSYCYEDDYFTRLNVANTEAFFAWLGVVKPSSSAASEVEPYQYDDEDTRLEAIDVVRQTTSEGFGLSNNGVAMAVINDGAAATGAPASAALQRGASIALRRGSINTLGARFGSAAGLLRTSSVVCDSSPIMSPTFQQGSPKENTIDPDRLCNICFEEKDDVRQIPHAAISGDVSEHRVCGACWKSSVEVTNECPFCREMVVKTELLDFVHKFVAAAAEAAKSGNQQRVTAVYADWELFEMLHENRPSVISRALLLVLQSSTIDQMFRRLADEPPTWLWSISGIFFRFRAAIRDDLPAEQSRPCIHLVDGVVDAIFSKLDAQVAAKTLDWTNAGVLYSQAGRALTSAASVGMSMDTLKETVDKLGTTFADLCDPLQGDARTAAQEAFARGCTVQEAQAAGALVFTRSDRVMKAFFTSEEDAANGVPTPPPTPPPSGRRTSSPPPEEGRHVDFVPAGGELQCYVRRSRTGGLFAKQSYFLYVKQNNGFVLAGRKSGNNFLMSRRANEFSREAAAYRGVVQAMSRSDHYVVLQKSGKGGHQALGFIVYVRETANEPRKVKYVMPRDGSAWDLDDHTTPDSLFAEYNANKNDERYLVLVNKPPAWNAQLEAYTLNFNGRVRVPSVKNFLLCDENNKERVLLLFGRVGDHDFSCDFKAPLSSTHAFAIALSCFS